MNCTILIILLSVISKIILPSCPANILDQVPGSPYTAGFMPGSAPVGAAFTPNGRFLAVASQFTDEIAVLRLNPVTGSLIPVSGSPFVAQQTSPHLLISFSPDGRFLATTNSVNNNISIYAINQTTGALSPIIGSPFAAQLGPIVIAYSPNGNFLAVTNNVSSSVSIYTINNTTGVPTLVGNFATGNGPLGLSFSPDNLFLAVANGFDSTISIYRVNQVTGTLTQISGSPVAINSVTPAYLSYLPNNTGAFVTDNDAIGSVTSFSVNSTTGLWTEIVPPVPSGSFTTAADVMPDGSTITATNQGNDDLSVFSVNPITNMLSFVCTEPAGTLPSLPVYSAEGTFLIVTNAASDNISVYRTSFLPAPIITSPVNNAVISSSNFIITGTAFSGSRINIFANNALIGTSTADILGNWSFNATLLPGSYAITAQAQDSAGRTSTLSSIINIRVSLAPSAPIILSPDSGSNIRQSTFTISGTSEANNTIIVTINDQIIFTTQATALGTWSITVTLPDGAYTITAQARNAFSQLSSLSNTVIITIDTQVPPVPPVPPRPIELQSALSKFIRTKYCSNL